MQFDVKMVGPFLILVSLQSHLGLNFKFWQNQAAFGHQVPKKLLLICWTHYQIIVFLLLLSKQDDQRTGRTRSNIDDIIMKNRWVVIKQMSGTLNISYKRVFHIIILTMNRVWENYQQDTPIPECWSTANEGDPAANLKIVRPHNYNTLIPWKPKKC